MDANTKTITAPQVLLSKKNGLCVLEISKEPYWCHMNRTIIEWATITIENGIATLKGVEVLFNTDFFFDGGKFTPEVAKEYEYNQSDLFLNKAWPWSKGELYFNAGTLLRNKEKLPIQIICNHFLIVDERDEKP